jgi:hypothetical protein
MACLVKVMDSWKHYNFLDSSSLIHLSKSIFQESFPLPQAQRPSARDDYHSNTGGSDGLTEPSLEHSSSTVDLFLDDECEWFSCSWKISVMGFISSFQQATGARLIHKQLILALREMKPMRLNDNTHHRRSNNPGNLEPLDIFL